MLLSRAALELGLQLVQTKLGQAMGAPGFSVYSPVVDEAIQPAPSIFSQTKKHTPATAHIRSPKIVTTR
jgi:hypothetical protein